MPLFSVFSVLFVKYKYTRDRARNIKCPHNTKPHRPFSHFCLKKKVRSLKMFMIPLTLGLFWFVSLVDVETICWLLLLVICSSSRQIRQVKILCKKRSNALLHQTGYLKCHPFLKKKKQFSQKVFSYWWQEPCQSNISKVRIKTKQSTEHNSFIFSIFCGTKLYSFST